MKTIFSSTLSTPSHPIPSAFQSMAGGHLNFKQEGKQDPPPPLTLPHTCRLSLQPLLTRFATGFVATDLPLVAKHLASNWVVLVVAKSVANLSDSRFSSTCLFWRRVFLRAPPGGWIFLLGGMLRVMLAKLGGCRDSAVRCEIFSSGNDDGT